MELKVLSERIEAAKKQCPQAAAVLNTIFPEVASRDIDLYDLLGRAKGWRELVRDRYDRGIIQIRNESLSPKYGGKTFFLGKEYDWSLVVDPADDTQQLLLPQRRV